MRSIELVSVGFLSLIFIILFLIYPVNGDLNDTNVTLQPNGTMTVTANIIGFRINPSLEGVGIQVPDSINIGNITGSNPVSGEFKIDINNTGTVDIIVTPQLADNNEGIFSYLYFISHMTSNGTSVPYTKIGDYSLNISAPASGSSVRKSYCYMRLNLTDLDSPINQDLVDHSSDIIFYAMPA